MERASLLGSKLRALVQGHWGGAGGVAAELPAGAARRDGGRAWVLLDGDPVRAFGPTLVWAAREGSTTSTSWPTPEQDSPAEQAASRPPPPSGGSTARCSRGRRPTPSRSLVRRSRPALDGLLVDADLEVVVEDGISSGAR